MEYCGKGICAPKGFIAAGVHCGIRKNKSKYDLGLVYSEQTCKAAAVYTTNKVYGAPITVTRANIADGYAKAIICNSGNANTCNADGVQKAERMCELVADELNIAKTDVVVASTGVIGQTLPIEPIAGAMRELCAKLSVDGSSDMATAIMTTDTVKKEYALKFILGGKECYIGAIAKGSGMIHPNMATMLSFVTTDANISASALDKALKTVVQDTYNMVSVDGDTSTNDMLVILANGLAGNDEISEDSADYNTFICALQDILTNISKDLARDGEGATKLLECEVIGAVDKDVARIVAKSVITSNLLKCAIFAADANWGRILCAIGYADADFDISKVDVDLCSIAGETAVCRGGSGVDFSETEAKRILSEKEIKIRVNLNCGAEKATAWGCDLTYDYVKINADYRT